MPRGFFILVLAFAACQSSEETEFPPGLAPLGDNTATLPGESGESVHIVTGAADGYDYGHARGRLRTDMNAVWEALGDPEVLINRRDIDRWTVTRDTEPAYEMSYRIHSVIEEIVTVEYDQDWRFGRTDEVIIGRYQKTQGSSFISVLEGSVIARPLSDDMVEIELVQHLGAVGGDDSTIVDYLQLSFDSLRARVHGQPLP